MSGMNLAYHCSLSPLARSTSVGVLILFVRRKKSYSNIIMYFRRPRHTGRPSSSASTLNLPHMGCWLRTLLSKQALMPITSVRNMCHSLCVSMSLCLGRSSSGRVYEMKRRQSFQTIILTSDTSPKAIPLCSCIFTSSAWQFHCYCTCERMSSLNFADQFQSLLLFMKCQVLIQGCFQMDNRSHSSRSKYSRSTGSVQGTLERGETVRFSMIRHRKLRQHLTRVMINSSSCLNI